MSKFSPMKQVDTFIFKQCDELKKTPFYQKISDTISSIDDDSRPTITFLASILFFLIPLAFILFFLTENISLQNNINTKEEIQAQVAEFIALKQNADQVFGRIISSPKIVNQGEFTNQIRAVAGTISPNKIVIQDFNVTELSDGLNQLNATIQLTDVHNEDLSLFLQNLSIQKKVLFQSSRLKRDEKKQLISGSIDVLQFTK